MLGEGCGCKVLFSLLDSKKKTVNHGYEAKFGVVEASWCDGVRRDSSCVRKGKGE